jgi:hypothetical protein
LIESINSPEALLALAQIENNTTTPYFADLAQYAHQTYVPPPPATESTIFNLLDSLESQKRQAVVLGWLSGEVIIDALDIRINTARIHLSAGDSLSCAKEIEQFLHAVDNEFADSLDGDINLITLEAWKFLHHNARYILRRLPSLGSIQVSAYSLFATHSLWLEQNSTVYSGDIGVNEAGAPPFLNSDVELTIGIGTTVSSGSVKAHRIKVKDGAMISADVSYNELENNGTITGSLHSPLSLPLVSALPEFKTATPGTIDITIPQGGTQTLAPGSYRDIRVRRNGTLILTGGEYHFNSFDTGDNARIMFQTASDVRIAQKFDSDQGSYIGPEDTTSLSADKIVFYVAGINGSSGTLSATPKAAQIGIANTVKANFYAPSGTLWIRQNSEVTGAFLGKDVDVGIGVKVWHKSAF